VTSTEIFKEYFRKKIIIWGGVGIIATLIRYLSGYETSFLFALIVILFLLLVGFITGYISYRFYEKPAPGIVAKLINQNPLSEFQSIGFSNEDDIKLAGYINGYKIFLAPIVNIDDVKALTVLIPLQIRDGLDDYFTKFDTFFKFHFSDQIVFAEAILKDYNTEYDFTELLNLLNTTIAKLKDKQIEPLKTVDE
jgi:hypothetical protein